VGQIAANLALADRYLRRAAQRGADLVVFPECFVQGYALEAEHIALAEPSDGEVVSALRSLAARHGVAIVIGFIEQHPADPSRPFNAAAVIQGDGRLVGVYRKTHLFRGEHLVFTAGDAYPVFSVRLGASGRPVSLGVAICADIEYPEVIRLLALAGAQLIAVPSADMEPYRAQQMANLLSRAVENNLYVALANTVDRRDEMVLFGGSGIAGPAGSLASAGYGRPRLVVAQLSDNEIALSGGVGGYLRGRRPETYTGIVEIP
jgi:predicted amidohydrolase